MNTELRKLLDKVESVSDFSGIRLESINDTNCFGDNALHCVCVWGDLSAAKLLVENGIDIEQKGEGGFTPLKVAVDFGHDEIADYLIALGANTNAINAEFEFDPEANARHMSKLSDEIEQLEKKIESDCNKNA